MRKDVKEKIEGMLGSYRAEMIGQMSSSSDDVKAIVQEAKLQVKDDITKEYEAAIAKISKTIMEDVKVQAAVEVAEAIARETSQVVDVMERIMQQKIDKAILDLGTSLEQAEVRLQATISERTDGYTGIVR